MENIKQQYSLNDIIVYKEELLKLIKKYPRKYSLVIKNKVEYLKLYEFIENISPNWLNGKHIKYKIANFLLDDLSCFSKKLALRFYIDVNFIKINSFNSNYDKLKFIVSTFNCYLVQIKRYDDGNLLKWINEKTPKLQLPEYTIDTKIYWILHNITDFPICDICKKNTLEHKNVISLENGYKSYNRLTKEMYKYTHCSESCALKDPDVVKAYEEKMLKKYGVKNPYQSEIVKEKIKKTNFEQYGVLYPMQNTELVAKAIKTKKQNNSYAQSLKKFNETSLEIYNVPFPMQSITVKNKSRISNLKTKYNKLCNDPEFDILFSFSDYLLNYKNKTYKFKFRCKICNNITYSHTCSIYKDINGSKHLVRCKHCFPTIRCTSKLEIDVLIFVLIYVKNLTIKFLKIIEKFYS